jgi:hypothetical protein
MHIGNVMMNAQAGELGAMGQRQRRRLGLDPEVAQASQVRQQLRPNTARGPIGWRRR